MRYLVLEGPGAQVLCPEPFIHSKAVLARRLIRAGYTTVQAEKEIPNERQSLHSRRDPNTL